LDGGFLVRQALEITELERSAVSLGELVELIAQLERKGLEVVHRVSSSELGTDLVEPSAPVRLSPGPRGHTAGDTEEPSGESVVLADRSGFASQDQERRLERVLCEVEIAKFAPTHPQHHRTMSAYQDLESLLCAIILARSKPREKFRVAHCARRA
jgi:hypothetical protein